MNKMKKLIIAIMVPSLVLFSGSILAKTEQGEKVLLCHNGNEISVSVHALDGHLRNHEDDNPGACAGDGPTVLACHTDGVTGDLTLEDISESSVNEYIAEHEGHRDTVEFDCI